MSRDRQRERRLDRLIGMGTSAMKGSKVSARKWKGTFRGSVVLRHRRTGKRFGRCSIGPIRWSATRRRPPPADDEGA